MQSTGAIMKPDVHNNTRFCDRRDLGKYIYFIIEPGSTLLQSTQMVVCDYSHIPAFYIFLAHVKAAALYVDVVARRAFCT